jgi:hypothetical protein
MLPACLWPPPPGALVPVAALVIPGPALGAATPPPGCTGVVCEPMWKKPVGFRPGGANCDDGGVYPCMRSPIGVPGLWAMMLSLLWL